MFLEYLKAFLVGGAICAVCQLVMDRTRLSPARILTGLVVLGVILGAFGLYQPLIDWAGGGATVPLLGFGNTIAKGTLEALRKDGLLGALTGGATAAAGGITAAMFFALVVALVFKPKEK